MQLQDRSLFKDLVFYLDVYTNGESAESYFAASILEHGGKISRRLGKHITHMLWSQGREKVLKKALEYENIKIVSTLWFQETLDELKLADEAKHTPLALI